MKFVRLKRVLRELVFGTEDQMQTEIKRLENSNQILRTQRGQAYKALNKDYREVKKKYHDIIVELAVSYYYETGHISRDRMDYIEKVLHDKEKFCEKIDELQKKLDKATEMLQKAGLECCCLVYEKIQKDNKKKLLQLQSELGQVMRDKAAVTERQKRLQKTFDELKGE